MIHLSALLGILSISFSAVFVRLAAVSPATATFFRTAYAIPVLAAAWAAVRSFDRRRSRDRWLAAASGLVLALDLNLWHQSIEYIGAGLGTVLANMQALFVGVAAWVLYRERPTRLALVMVPAVLVGVMFISGLGRAGAYGSRPALGVAFGVLAGAFYAGYLLMFRAANRELAPTAGPLLEATAGAAVGALVSGWALDPRFSLAITWPAHGWLVALALICQALGWLLIAVALPRLPALETSVLLLVQPFGTVLWSRWIFGERLSPFQLR